MERAAKLGFCRPLKRLEVASWKDSAAALGLASKQWRLITDLCPGTAVGSSEAAMRRSLV